MGLIDTMAITSAMWSGVVPAPGMTLWVLMVATLATAAAGIWLAVPRQQRPLTRAVRLRSVEAH